MEEKKRSYSQFVSSPLFVPSELSVLDSGLLTQLFRRRQATVSSATLNGRWYLQVPAAWGRAVLLSDAATATCSSTTNSSKRYQFAYSSIKIQPRHPISFPLAPSHASRHPQSVRHVWPSSPRPACHDEWQPGSSTFQHADPQVSIPSSPCTCTASSPSRTPQPTSGSAQLLRCGIGIHHATFHSEPYAEWDPRQPG